MATPDCQRKGDKSDGEGERGILVGGEGEEGQVQREGDVSDGEGERE